MCALCRTTTSPDTFILLGGDCAHHGAEWRPTEYLPLPDEIKPSPLRAIHPNVCPGALFTPIHRFHHEGTYSSECDRDASTHPFFTVRDESSHNGVEARESVEHMSDFDAHDNILTMIAHDNTMLDVVDVFPKASANDWKKKGWRRRRCGNSSAISRELSGSAWKINLIDMIGEGTNERNWRQVAMSLAVALMSVSYSNS